MFVLAVTRNSISGRIQAKSVREWTLNGWVVTVATDEWLSRANETAGRVAVREALRFGDEGTGSTSAELPYALASFSSADNVVEITKPLIGGGRSTTTWRPAASSTAPPT